MLGSIIQGIFGLGSTVISTIFGIKKEKSQIIESALNVMNNANASESEKARAAALIIVAENQSGGIAAMWRPMLMCVFAGLILSYWFGYTPSNMPVTHVDRVFDLLELGIGGYVGGRTIEKVVQSINFGVIINKFISKIT